MRLVAVENDPTRFRPNGPTVLNGSPGLCAIFAVTNLSQDVSIWFDTCAIEQKVGGEWRRIPVPPYQARVSAQLRIGATPWFAIASDEVNHVYPPGTCWNYVVAWPREVPTNATWRLEVRYGRQPSARARKLDDAIGFNLFARRGKAQSLSTPEVNPP